MRVIQRLMGMQNPITTLRVYEHTLHFRGGIAVIEHLTEREINRLRAFGFRVERDAKKGATVPKTPEDAIALAASLAPSPAKEIGANGDGKDTDEGGVEAATESSPPSDVPVHSAPPKPTPSKPRPKP
jgi:hypothetical protein